MNLSDHSEGLNIVWGGGSPSILWPLTGYEAPVTVKYNFDGLEGPGITIFDCCQSALRWSKPGGSHANI